MIQDQIHHLWTNYRDATTRDAIVDTLVLALDMRTVFTEEQLLAGIAFLMDICEVQDDEIVLDILHESVQRVNALSQEEAAANIGLRLAHLKRHARETVMLMAIIYFHFSAPDNERPLMRDSILPLVSVELGVTNAVPHLLYELRRELNKPVPTKRPDTLVC
jgi:hypothetical protein